MGLNETPDQINWSESFYLYVEKKGDFQKAAPQAWQEFHSQRGEVEKIGKAKAYSSLYRLSPNMIYRAGVFLSEKPQNIPPGLSFDQIQGGLYTRFTLKGPYSQLPEACGRVFELVKKLKIQVADNYFIENYVNDPNTTPEAELITEILIPTRL